MIGVTQLKTWPEMQKHRGELADGYPHVTEGTGSWESLFREITGGLCCGFKEPEDNFLPRVRVVSLSREVTSWDAERMYRKGHEEGKPRGSNGVSRSQSPPIVQVFKPPKPETDV